jgi:hypothetical protein
VLVELYQLPLLESETPLDQLQVLAERVYIESAVITAATRAFLRALRTDRSKKRTEIKPASPEEPAK